MLRDTVAQWDEGSSMRAVLETLGQMVADAAEVFDRAWKVCKGKASLEAERGEVRRHDKAVNRGERSVRRALMEHLSINPGNDAEGCLAIMNMAKDIERLGDHGSNLLGLCAKTPMPLSKTKLFGQLDAVAAKIASLFPLLQEAIQTCSEERTRAVLEIYQDIQGDMKAVQAALFASDFGGAEAVASTLLTRYLTRLNAHAGNAASAVVFPVETIDHVGRGLREAEEAAE